MWIENNCIRDLGTLKISCINTYMLFNYIVHSLYQFYLGDLLQWRCFTILIFILIAKAFQWTLNLICLIANTIRTMIYVSCFCQAGGILKMISVSWFVLQLFMILDIKTWTKWVNNGPKRPFVSQSGLVQRGWSKGWGASSWNACCSSVRSWDWILRTHLNVNTVAQGFIIL